MTEPPAQIAKHAPPTQQSPVDWERSRTEVAASQTRAWSPLVVPVWVENPAEVESVSQPLTFGVPLPRGQVCAPCAAHFCLNKQLPANDDSGDSWRLAQARPLAYWSDGSVRWLLIDAICPPLPPGRSAGELRVVPAGAASSPADHLSVSQESEQRRHIRTTTGPESQESSASNAWFQLAAHEAAFLEHRLSAEEAWGSLQALLTDARGHTHAARFGTLAVEEIGPVRATFAMTGALPKELGLRCRLRISFFKDSGLVKLQITLHNPRRARHEGGVWDLGDPGSIYFQSWALQLALPKGPSPSKPSRVAWQPEPASEPHAQGNDFFLYQDSSGGENWRSPAHINRSGRVPCQFRGYRLKHDSTNETGLRASPTVAVGDEHGVVAVGVPEFWQNFPMALQANLNGIEVGLFPGKWSDRFELQGGEQKTHTVWLNFQSAASLDTNATSEAVRALANITHCPLLAGCPATWHVSAEAMPWLVAGTEPQAHEVCREILRSALEGEESFAAKRETIDEFGWRHYGDVWADHEQAQYRGPGLIVSHYNNQFDMLSGACRQFMQSGDGAWWGFASALARHVIDIDLYRTTLDRAAYNGGLFWFTDHFHTASTATHRTYSRHNAPRREGSKETLDYGGGPGSEHNFSTGLLYYYWMTGEPSAAEAVRMLADWVIAMDDGRLNVLGLLDDGPTGLASMTNQLAYQGPGRGAANSMQSLLDAWLLTGEQKYSTKLDEILRRVIHPADKIEPDELLDAEHHWSYTMFLAALVRSLETKAEQGADDETTAYARASLLAYARWMVAHERPYLDHPEQLQYPTETWAAQDLRKANVLRQAALYADNESEAERMSQCGAALADRAWNDLRQFSTRQTTRAVAIVMTEGAIDGSLRFQPRQWRPTSASRWYDFGKPSAFVPQKQRIRAASRAPRGVARLTLAALRPAAWLRLLRLYRLRRGTFRDQE